MRLLHIVFRPRGRRRWLWLTWLLLVPSVSEVCLAERYKVGFLAPLSGEKASLGLAVLNGVTLALDSFNRSNVDQVELVRFDSMGQMEAANRGARHLCDLEGVWAIIGPLGNNSAMAAASYCQVRGVTMISPTATRSDLTSIGPAIFRMNYSSEYQGRMIGEYAVVRLGYTNYAVLFPDTDYGRGFMNGFVQRITELGAVVMAVESYPDGTTDFQHRLERIRELAPEALYIPAPPEDVILVSSQIAYMRLIVQVLGNSNWGNEMVLEEADRYVGNAIFTLDRPPDSETGPLREFIRLYRDRFAEDPFLPWAALGYDSMKLILMGLGNHLPSRALLPEAVAKIANYNGASGFLRDFENGNPNKLIMFGTVLRGRVVPMSDELLAASRLRGEEMARLRQIAADSLLMAADSLGLGADSLGAAPGPPLIPPR